MYVCTYLTLTQAILSSVVHLFFFDIGKVCLFNTVKKTNTIATEAGLLSRVHTGAYVEKRPCYYYNNQSHLQLVYGITRARYTGEHGFQCSGVRGMSLLETSSSEVYLFRATFTASTV